MLHTFECLGQYILLDVESGAVHVVDELVHEVAKLYQENLSCEEIISRLPQFDAAEVAEAVEELDQLREDGLLCATTDPVELGEAAARNKNVVKSMCLHIAHDCNLR